MCRSSQNTSCSRHPGHFSFPDISNTKASTRCKQSSFPWKSLIKREREWPPRSAHTARVHNKESEDILHISDFFKLLLLLLQEKEKERERETRKKNTFRKKVGLKKCTRNSYLEKSNKLSEVVQFVLFRCNFVFEHFCFSFDQSRLLLVVVRN